MKKLFFAAATLGTILFASCTKENVQPQKQIRVMEDKGNLSNADFTQNPPADGDKGNLSNADGTGNGGN